MGTGEVGGPANVGHDNAGDAEMHSVMDHPFPEDVTRDWSARADAQKYRDESADVGKDVVQTTADSVRLG